MYETCPRCREELVVKTYSEDGHIVEVDRKCYACGYHRGWAYGMDYDYEEEDNDET